MEKYYNVAIHDERIGVSDSNTLVGILYVSLQ